MNRKLNLRGKENKKEGAFNRQLKASESRRGYLG